MRLAAYLFALPFRHPYLTACALLFLVGFSLTADLEQTSGIRPPAGVSPLAQQEIPGRYLEQYRKAGARYDVPWQVLAGIGKVESDHGRSSAPGVRSGVNRFGCCAGPMQFNLRNGPPSTWDAYGRGGSPYKPNHAIPAAARLLVANGARRDLDRAIYGYNHSWAYVRTVKAWATRYRTGGLAP